MAPSRGRPSRDRASLVHLRSGADDRGLGGAVEHPHPGVREGPAEVGQQLGGHHVAADEEAAEGGAAAVRMRSTIWRMRAGTAWRRVAVSRIRGQPVHVQGRLAGHQDGGRRRRAGRAQQLEEEDVEGEGG